MWAMLGVSGVAGANGVVSGSSVSEGLIGGVAVSESETERSEIIGQ